MSVVDLNAGGLVLDGDLGSSVIVRGRQKLGPAGPMGVTIETDSHGQVFLSREATETFWRAVGRYMGLELEPEGASEGPAGLQDHDLDITLEADHPGARGATIELAVRAHRGFVSGRPVLCVGLPEAVSNAGAISDPDNHRAVLNWPEARQLRDWLDQEISQHEHAEAARA